MFCEAWVGQSVLDWVRPGGSEGGGMGEVGLGRSLFVRLDRL
jgi:hypothetical protein